MLHPRRLLVPLLLAVAVATVLWAGMDLRHPFAEDWAEEAAEEEGLVYLSDLEWSAATTGWLAVADRGIPALDANFAGRPMRLSGTVVPKGIGTYPTSEITYRLDGSYSAFSALVGIDDESPPGSIARFMVFLDQVLAYDSGPVRSGEPPRTVQVALPGVTELRLVVSEVPGGGVPYADWAAARLLRPPMAPPAVETITAEQLLADLAARREALEAARSADLERLRATGARDAAAVRELLDQASVTGTAWTYDPERGLVVVGNPQVAVSMGIGGTDHGLLSVVDMAAGRPILWRVSPRVRVSPNRNYLVARDTQPHPERPLDVEEVDDPAVGPATRLRARYLTEDGVTIEVGLTLPRVGSRWLYELAVDEVDSAPGRAATFVYFDRSSQNLLLGKGLSYFTDFSRPRWSAVPDDDVLRRESVGLGKPLFLWNSGEDGPAGLLLATLDEAEGPASFAVHRSPGRVASSMGFSSPPRAHTTGDLRSPRLLVELVDSTDLRMAFAGYRAIFERLYPPAPLPEWVRYQWLSWYTYYMDIDEAKLRRQIDYIAENLSDLGPWHIIVDAGWYVAEGRPGSEWRTVDTDKFHSGLRALVDYAHSRGVRVVLYISFSAINSSRRAGDWLGLSTLIQDHPSWLVRIASSEAGDTYVYDWSNHEVRSYFRQVLDDFFSRYDVDGIKVDGLGNSEGVIPNLGRLRSFGLADEVDRPVMDIYRLVYSSVMDLRGAEAYIESGWLAPMFANQYAHTFRYGDEASAFSNPYPFPGLVEHVDYAAVQHAMGQRANMGAVLGDPNWSEVNRWWIEAALALGNQVAISFDLPEMDPATLAHYRALLAHYRPFAGRTTLGPGLYPQVFATHRDGTTYLGVINRASESRTMEVDLEDLGIPAHQDQLAYDVETDTFLRVRGTLLVDMAPQSFRLFLLRDTPGVMWSTSSVREELVDRGMRARVAGPPSVPGSLRVYAPPPRDVRLDGLSLREGPQPGPGTYSYDARTGVLHLTYHHDREHTVEVRW